MPGAERAVAERGPFASCEVAAPAALVVNGNAWLSRLHADAGIMARRCDELPTVMKSAAVFALLVSRGVAATEQTVIDSSPNAETLSVSAVFAGGRRTAS